MLMLDPGSILIFRVAICFLTLLFCLNMATLNGKLSDFSILQGESGLVIQLCQLITFSYVHYIKYPFNHLILYMGDFVWHIECIDVWP